MNKTAMNSMHCILVPFDEELCLILTQEQKQEQVATLPCDKSVQNDPIYKLRMKGEEVEISRPIYHLQKLFPLATSLTLD